MKSLHNIVQKQLDVMLRVGNVGKFMAFDLIDRVSAIGSAISSNLDRMTEQEKEKYKEFLLAELVNSTNKKISTRKSHWSKNS